MTATEKNLPLEAVILMEGGAAEVSLENGIAVGGVTYRRAVLRQLSAGDLMEAQEAAERLVHTAGGELALVSSPARMGMETLRRQVARLTGGDGPDFHGPLETTQFNALSAVDLKLLENGLDLLDKHFAAAMDKLARRGRPAAGGGGDAPAAGQAGGPDGPAV